MTYGLDAKFSFFVIFVFVNQLIYAEANSFMVRTSLDDDQLRPILDEHGFIIHGRPEHDLNLVHISHKSALSLDHSKSLIDVIKQKNGNAILKSTHDPAIEIHKRSLIAQMRKRVQYAKRILPFVDPKASQWQYLDTPRNAHAHGVDINVYPVWAQGITGEGITTRLLDDSIDNLHPDLKQNYAPEVSYNLCDPENQGTDARGPKAVMPKEEFHGTNIAGVIASVANNSICSHGVAYNSRVGLIRMFCKNITHALLTRAVGKFYNTSDTMGSSWGPTDDGKSTGGPAEYLLEAYDNIALTGRNEKGILNVFAGGNGRFKGDNCGADGFVNYPRAIAVAALRKSGDPMLFSEKCSAIHISAPIDAGITTTNGNSKCTSGFSGTSAAAPVITGVLALVLQVNRNLTQRDVKHILSIAGRVPTVKPSRPDYQVNAAGLLTSPSFGSGLIDASLAVKIAKKWRNVGDLCQIIVQNKEKAPTTNRVWSQINDNNTDFKLVHIPANPLLKPITGRITKLHFSFNQSQEGLYVYPLEAKKSSSPCHIQRLENVQVHLKIEHVKMGEVSVTLTSPSGTIANLLFKRKGHVVYDLINFAWTAVSFYGEDPRGEWVLRIHDKNPLTREKAKSGKVRGQIHGVSLILEGNTIEQSAYERNKDTYDSVLTRVGKEAKKAGRGHKLNSTELKEAFSEQYRRYFYAFSS